MCALFTRDLRPELLTRLESLLHPPFLESDDPWKYSFQSYGARSIRGWNHAGNQDNFHLFMSGKQFRASEIDIKVEDGSVVVEAKHGEDSSHSGLKPSEFFRRSYKLPEGIDPATFTFAFNQNDLLVITTSKKAEIASSAPALDAVVSEPEKSHDAPVVKDEAETTEKVD